MNKPDDKKPGQPQGGSAPKNAVEDQEDVKKREAEQHQQPVPMQGDPVKAEYERPLPQPGDKDYVAGQPVDDAEADKTEGEVKKRMEEAEQRREDAERKAKGTHETTQPRGPHGHQSQHRK